MKPTLLILLLLFALKVKSQNYEFYISDAGNFSNPPWQLLKFDSTGQNPSVFISDQLAWPQDIVFLEDSGTVLVSNLNSGNISRYSSADGSFISNFATGVGGPTRMKIGNDTLLYVLQWTGDGLVRRYYLDGTLKDNFTSVAVPQSIGLDWDASGNLYVSSYTGKYVRKFDSQGADLGIFVDSLAGPTNIWIDASSNILVVDYDGNSVKKFDSNGVFVENFITGINQGEGVYTFPNGDLILGCGATHSVRRYDSSGNYLSDFIAPNSGGLKTPNAVIRRNVVPLYVDEKSFSKSLTVYPTVGTEFNFSERIEDTKSIGLYSMDGKFVQRLTLNNKKWKAEGLSEGFYLVRAVYKDGEVENVKIYVK